VVKCPKCGTNCMTTQEYDKNWVVMQSPIICRIGDKVHTKVYGKLDVLYDDKGQMRLL